MGEVGAWNGSMPRQAISDTNVDKIEAIKFGSLAEQVTGSNGKKKWVFDPYSKGVSYRVGKDYDSFGKRYKAWQKVIDLAVRDGGNPYEGMRAALRRLGFTSRQGSTGQLCVSPRARQPFLWTEQSLNAEGSLDAMAAEPEYLIGDRMWMFDDAAALRQLQGLEEVVQLSTARNAAVAICGVAAPRSAGVYSVSPFFDAFNHVWKRPSDKIYSEDEAARATVQILKPPAHGSLEARDVGARFNYVPAGGFEGKDTFVVRIAVPGRRVVDLHYTVMVYAWGADWGPEHDCAKPPFRGYSYVPELGEQGRLSTWQRWLDLASVLAEASRAVTGFGPLDDPMVGRTESAGRDFRIILDTDAAGHGWYVDATPLAMSRTLLNS